MTRSGFAAAMLAATWANGQAGGTLQFWNLPGSSSSASPLVPPGERFAAFRRQPVSPNAAMDFSSPWGSGSAELSIAADLVPDGIGSSQTSTGNVASGVART